MRSGQKRGFIFNLSFGKALRYALRLRSYTERKIDGNRKASLAASNPRQDTEVHFSLQNTFLAATHTV